MRDGELGPMRMSAARLGALLHSPHAPADRDAAWQDSLDLLATASGLKPAALLGCGYPAQAWLDEVATIASASGLAVARGGMPWVVAEELAGLPGWYVAPLRESWAAADMLLIGPTLPRAAVLSITEEAELLGYPACCVADHHARRRRYHRLAVELIEAAYQSASQRRRFAASELPPPLRSESDRERLAEALAGTPLDFVSFNPCPVCLALGARGPAGRIAARFRALAMASGLAPAATEASNHG